MEIGLLAPHSLSLKTLAAMQKPNMTVKHLFRLIFLICLYGCSGNSDDNANRKRIGEKQFGLFIEHGPRQGFQYFDSIRTEYNYRYSTMTITNDSIIPIHLEIFFLETARNLIDSGKSKAFLLPRHLTPKEHNFYQSNPQELKRFLDFEIDKSVHINKTLKPTEKCVLTFGVLTDTKYPDPTTPFGMRLLTSHENSSVVSIKLKINDNLIIPCGQFSYTEK